MHHTGTLFVGKKHRPTVDKDSAGAFRLELVLVDNMGRNPHTGRDEKESYRVRWSGPEAQAFWSTHSDALKTPGTPLHVELERLRALPGPQAFPPMPELVGRVLHMKLLPHRASSTPTTPEAATA